MLKESEIVIELANVSKYFGTFQALKDVSLSVSLGEKVVVCGPSGSGKSTMIRCLNRLEEHDEGKILVNGVELSDDVESILKVRREAGMVFQQFNLFPHLTVLENITLGPVRALGFSRQEAADLAMGLLERVQIPDQAHKYPSQLSGGQQQRVAIARSLCMQPKLMLFDEPTTITVRKHRLTAQKLTTSKQTQICQSTRRTQFQTNSRYTTSAPRQL